MPKGSITKYESKNFKQPFYIIGYVIEQCIEIWWYFLNLGWNSGYWKSPKKNLNLTLWIFYHIFLGMWIKHKKGYAQPSPRLDL
jgi:hypothetical protein